MNWQRGSTRIWLLLSAAWIIGWTVNLIVEGIRVEVQPREFPCDTGSVAWPADCALLFGSAAGWAFRGFKPDSSNRLGGQWPPTVAPCVHWKRPVPRSQLWLINNQAKIIGQVYSKIAF